MLTVVDTFPRIQYPQPFLVRQGLGLRYVVLFNHRERSEVFDGTTSEDSEAIHVVGSSYLH